MHSHCAIVVNINEFLIEALKLIEEIKHNNDTQNVEKYCELKHLKLANI